MVWQLFMVFVRATHVLKDPRNSKFDAIGVMVYMGCCHSSHFVRSRSKNMLLAFIGWYATLCVCHLGAYKLMWYWVGCQWYTLAAILRFVIVVISWGAIGGTCNWWPLGGLGNTLHTPLMDVLVDALLLDLFMCYFCMELMLVYQPMLKLYMLLARLVCK